MNLNPFSKKKDDLQRELDANKQAQLLAVAASPSAAQEEQVILEQQKDRAELTRWQQDMSMDIVLMIHRFKNEVEDENGVWVKRKIIQADGTLVDAPPLCSDECIWRLVALLEPSTSKNLMMSKYEKEYILNVLHRLADTVAIDILLPNRKRWGISMSDMSLIVDIFRTAADPTYFRALGANEKEYLKGIRKDTYLHTNDEQKEKRFLNL